MHTHTQIFQIIAVSLFSSLPPFFYPEHRTNMGCVHVCVCVCVFVCVYTCTCWLLVQPISLLPGHAGMTKDLW